MQLLMKFINKNKLILISSILLCLSLAPVISQAEPAQSLACPVSSGHHHLGHQHSDHMSHSGGMAANNRITQLAEGQCSSCHGTNGTGVSDNIPNLAGQESLYMCGWLAGCRQQGDKCEGHEDIAGKLSDQDIVDLAEYYAQLPSSKW